MNFLNFFFKTLQIESVMGPMPHVAKIYKFSDPETKKNLKLASKAFWRVHTLEKFQLNFSEAQESRHRQLYCYGNCPKTDEYEVSIRFTLGKISNVLFSHVSNRRCTPPIVARSVQLTSRAPVTDGWSIHRMLPGRSRRNNNKSRNGVAVDHAGTNSVIKIQNTKFSNNCTYLFSEFK